MNIAFFNYQLLEKGGGTARFFKDVSIGLKKKYPHLDISIVTFDKNLSSKINNFYSFYFSRNIAKELFSSESSLRKDLSAAGISYAQVKSLNGLRNILKTFDIVYSKNDILEAFILKFIVGKAYLKKVIFGFHTPIYYEYTPSWQAIFHNRMYSSFFYRFLLKNAYAFHVLNKYDERLLKLQFQGKIVKKIYNPFNFQVSRKGQQHKNENKSLQKNTLTLVWVGRLTKEKGADDLLELIVSINNSSIYKKICWKIAGTGQYENQIKALSKQFTNVTYLGYIGDRALTHVYKNSDVLISTSKWESFPYTFIEAQSHGLPIISYNIHGCNEIVKNNINGYLVVDLEQFEEVINSYVKDEKKLIKKTHVKKYIRKLINNELIFRKLYELFDTN